jgi:hypothetical protein
MGESVVVPGDKAERTAFVRNDGPGPALVTVQIIEVDTSDAFNRELEDNVHLYWDIAGRSGDVMWSEARNAADEGVSYEVTFPIARGATFHITAGYYVPIDATGGRNLGQDSTRLVFAVKVTLQEDTSPNPPVVVDTGGWALPR